MINAMDTFFSNIILILSLFSLILIALLITIQPLYALIECGVSTQFGARKKTIFMLLLFFLWVFASVPYGLFITRSRPLKWITLGLSIPIGFLVGLLITILIFNPSTREELMSKWGQIPQHAIVSDGANSTLTTITSNNKVEINPFQFHIRGDHQAEIAAYTTLLEANPGDISRLISRGAAYLEVGESEKAHADGKVVLQEAERRIANDQHDAEAIYFRGRAYRLLGDLNKAANDIRRAVEMKPDNKTWRLILDGLEIETKLKKASSGF